MDYVIFATSIVLILIELFLIKFHKKWLTITSLFLTLVLVVLSFITSQQMNKTALASSHEYVKRMNPYGVSFFGGEAERSQIANLMSDVIDYDMNYDIKKLHYTVQCSDYAIKSLKRVIQKMPEFPFSYLALYECTKLGKYKSLAIFHLEQTTSLWNHDVTHDLFLDGLKNK